MISTINVFLKSELKNFDLELTTKSDGSDGVDFLIGNNELYLQSINLDNQRSIKIPKQNLGEPHDTLFVALVLVINKEPQGLYFIPSRHLCEPDNYIFYDNEVSSIPSLSNWEIKVFTNAIPELNKFSLSNMIDKLKT